MAKFILRVQLSLDTHKNYTLLMNSLIKIGFSKCVESKNGTTNRLPNGNYFIESNTDIGLIFVAVTKITINDPKAMIVLTEVKGDGLIWAGLGSC